MQPRDVNGPGRAGPGRAEKVRPVGPYGPKRAESYGKKLAIYSKNWLKYRYFSKNFRSLRSQNHFHYFHYNSLCKFSKFKQKIIVYYYVTCFKTINEVLDVMFRY